MTSRRRLGVLACLLAGVMACLAPAAAQPTPREPSLAQVVGADPGDDLSLAIRDYLAEQRDDQPAAKARMVPDTGAGRPTYNVTEKKSCLDGIPVCIHYVTTGRDKVTTAYLAQVKKTMRTVYTTYQNAGFKMPEPDGTDGGSADTDIYLWDMASHGYDGFYGYCAPWNATDQRSKPAAAKDSSAYCALDNDYAASEYGQAQTPLNNLRVTAAHEFFHAVQFAYDWLEDDWFAEATATWAEDEVFTDINDNRQYLPYGPLGKPGQPMDTGDYYNSGANNFGVYGDWLFFRYLSERFPAKTGALPSIVRQMWEAADSTGTYGKDRYSIQAVAAVLAQHKTSLQQQWGLFTDANRHPARAYSEGRAYRAGPAAGRVALGGKKRQASGHYAVDHLAAATERVVPKGVRRAAQLRITVKTARAAISAATVSAWLKSGAVRTKVVGLKGGHGQVSMPFASAKVTKVEITLANAAAMYRCDAGTSYSCEGRPLRDNLRLSWTAKLIK